MTSPCSKNRVCADGERYVQAQLASSPKRAILSCEGACIKGEIARTTANLIAYHMHRDSAVRICLGDAATGSSGMTHLVERAPEVIAIEGCPLCCGLTLLRTRLPGLKATVIDTSQLCTFDRENHFEIFDLPHEEIERLAQQAAETISRQHFKNTDSTCGCGCS